jgi:hypothetical protein
MCTADARSTIDAHGMQSHVRAGEWRAGLGVEVIEGISRDLTV